MRRQSILLVTVFLCVSVSPVFGDLYAAGYISSVSSQGLVRVNPADMSYQYLDDTGFLRDATGLTYVPVPSAVILGSLGLTFSGWLLRKRKML